MPRSPGDPVRVETTKWPDRPHWAFDAIYLGSDEHGDWLGIDVGVAMDRPGAHVVVEAAQVGLVPTPGPDRQRGWLATFHAEPWETHTYVDMTSPPVWDGEVVRAVDLDLDVIRMREGFVLVDDEDEFAEHQMTYAYPAEIIALAEHTRDAVLEAVLEERPPYDETPARWFSVLEGLLAGRA